MEKFLTDRFLEIEHNAISTIRTETMMNVIEANADRIHRCAACKEAISLRGCTVIEITDPSMVEYRGVCGYTYQGRKLSNNGRIVRKRFDDGTGARMFYVETPIRDLKKATEYFRANSLGMAKELGINYYNMTDISLDRWWKLPIERKVFAQIG